jgi:rhomboid protease GluP
MPYPAGMSPGSMICPDCGKLIGVDEDRCPFCGAWRPSFFGLTPWIQRLFGRRLDLDRVIVVACVALYVLSLALQPRAIFQMQGGGLFGGLFGFLRPGDDALVGLGMTDGPAWWSGRWWTIFSAIYLHGSLLHIFFNLMCIRQLGPAVTRVYGQGRSFIVFTVSGAAGFLVSDLLSGAPTLGASGGIMGLAAALIVFGRRRHISMLTAQLWQWVIIMLVMGFAMSSSVNNLAHIGGFAGGWGVASLMRFEDEKRETPLVQILALALLALTVFAVVMSFVRAIGLIPSAAR